VRREADLIQLFDPPFDKSSLNPGYIKGYVPGVRENGGQYTHAAIWVVMALLRLGENDLAWELFALLNPVNHGSSSARIATYKVEPYVVAADVYSASRHVGRGGWTWYTGSAAWMYRLIIESMLGLHLTGARLRIEPRIPTQWRGFKVQYRYRETTYHLRINRVAEILPGGLRIIENRQISEGNTLDLRDDRQPHQVEIQLGAQAAAKGEDSPAVFAEQRV
jgi:cellobiose phosphorylase